jgi:hypothetical protein
MIAEGLLISPEVTEALVYTVILLFGGEKALQMKRKKNGGNGSITDGKILAVRLAAVEDAIREMAISDVRIAVAELREAVDGVKGQLKEIWAEIKGLRKAG